MKSTARKRSKVKIVIVDDHPIVRERLAELINQQADLTVVGACSDSLQCLELVKNDPVDLAIVDLSLERELGFDLIRKLRALYPQMHILVLSMHNDPVYVERALLAGAHGYVTKQDASQTIMTAIRAVHGGAIYVSENLSKNFVGALVQHRRPEERKLSLESLTGREDEIIRLIGQGHSTRQIAELLKIDVKTVETHQARLKEKFCAQSVDELRRLAALWVDDHGR